MLAHTYTEEIGKVELTLTITLLYLVLASIIAVVYFFFGGVYTREILIIEQLYGKFIILTAIVVIAIVSLGLVSSLGIKVRSVYFLRIVFYGILLLVFAQINSIISEFVKYNSILATLTIAIPLILGGLFLILGFAGWLVFRVELGSAIKHLIKSSIIALLISFILIMVIYRARIFPTPRMEVYMPNLIYYYSLMLISIISLIFHSTIKPQRKLISSLRVIAIILSLSVALSSIMSVITLIYQVTVEFWNILLTILYITGFSLFCIIIPLTILFILEREMPTFMKLSAIAGSPQVMDHGRSILLEYSLTESHIGRIVSIIQKITSPYNTIVLVSYKASPILRNIINTISKENKKCIIVLYDSKTMYPQEISENTYASMLDPTHIISIINRLKSRYRRENIALIYDNLTDTIITSNFKVAYFMTKDILSVLNSKDTAIFLLVKGSLSDRDYNTIKSLFETTISITA